MMEREWEAKRIDDDVPELVTLSSVVAAIFLALAMVGVAYAVLT